MGRFAHFAWRNTSTTLLAALLATTASIEVNAKLGIGAARFRAVRRRLVATLRAQGVELPYEVLGARLPKPFSVVKWRRCLQELAGGPASSTPTGESAQSAA